MVCDSRKNATNELSKRGIIDTSLNLKEGKFNEFSKANIELSKSAKDKYGVYMGGTLFSLQEVGENLRVVPDKEMFSAIDAAMNTVVVDDDFGKLNDVSFDEQFTPGYEKLTLFKKSLISRLENRLSKIIANKKKFSTDASKIKELIKQEHAIRERLEGDPHNDINGLSKELSMLENSPPIEKLNYYAREDFDRLEVLAGSELIEDLQEAESIIRFYEALGTVEVGVMNPLFTQLDMFDTVGNTLLPKEVLSVVHELKDIAIGHKNIIDQKKKEAVMGILNSSEKVRGVFKDGVKYEEVFHTKNGLKDASWVDMFLMDVTNGTFSHNGIVPQVMMGILQDTMEKHLVYAKKVETRITDIQGDLEEKLAELGYSITVRGVGTSTSYELFRAKNNNGQFEDSVTQRYTTNYTNEKDKMMYKFRAENKAAEALEDTVARGKATLQAYAKRDNWLRQNTRVLDIDKIPEIVNNVDFKDLSSTFKEDLEYTQNLKSLLGEQGYKEEVAKQTKLLYEYKAALEVYKDGVLTESSVSEEKDLPDKLKRKIDIWEKKNNPFVFVDSYNKGATITSGKLQLNSTSKFNYAVPRKNKIQVHISDGSLAYKETSESTGYFDERFKIIESNPALKEFHEVVMDSIEMMYDVYPQSVRSRFNSSSLPALQKDVVDLLTDKNTALTQRLTSSSVDLYDKIKGLAGMKVISNEKDGNIDPITGKPDTIVSSGFLKANKQEINKRFSVEILRLKQAMGINLVGDSNKNLTYNLSRVSHEAISIIAENLGVEASYEAIDKALPSTDLRTANIEEILKSGITDQVIKGNTFDLPKVVKLFSYLTMEYAARQESLPAIEMLKKHYNEIKGQETDRLGRPIINKVTGETRLEKERIRATRQMQSWIDRAVLGNYEAKNEIGNSKVKNSINLELTPDEEKDLFKTKLKTFFNGRIYDTEEKLLKKKIPKIKDSLKNIIEDKDSSPEEKSEAGSALKKLELLEENLGKHVTFTTLVDAILNYVRFLRLAYNLSSSVTNFIEGQLSNQIVASSGDYFKEEHIYRANHIVKGSFLKSITFGKAVTTGAKKARILMDRYRVLQDASNELQKASSKSNFSKLSQLSPYEITKRTEYLNQTPLMIATLLDKTLIGKNGEESNIWDAMTPEGVLKDEFATEENKANWERADGKDYNNFSSHLKKTIVNTHGDYDELRGIMASEYMTGKILLSMKKWIGRQIYQRFASVEQTDLEVGVKDFKGRYLSHNRSTGLLHGSVIGAMGIGLFGPIGMLVGGGVGVVTAALWGSSTQANILTELSFSTKELFLSIMRMSVNNLTGKATIGETDYSVLGDISQRDINNMKSNFAEMAALLAMQGMYLIVKGLFYDEDDEEDSIKRRTHNLLANRLMTLSAQSSMYVNPSTWEDVVGGVTVLDFLMDVTKVASDVGEAIEGKDVTATGINAGKSALAKSASKIFLPGVFKSGLGFKTQTERQFSSSPMDDWFKSEETNAKSSAAIYRAKYRRELYDKGGFSKKEILHKVNQKFNPKGRNETYIETLARYELVD